MHDVQDGSADPLSPVEIGLIDRYWRAANYVSVGQIYLLDNPLLSQPVRAEHVKPRLLGHWGTTPGLNFIYAHLNRIIRARNVDILYICGPGHGGPAMVANTYLEGTYSEIYPEIGCNTDGLRRLFRQFSFPGGVPSHAAPETPGSIHEGGELGYALVHAYGAAFDNPELIVACVVGDGEAETGPLAAAWHSNKFLNPARDGAVLPILHLNGYKIANPTILGRMSDEELRSLFAGYGYEPLFVEGSDPTIMHQLMAATLDKAFDSIRNIQARARAPQWAGGPSRWPMIVLRSPKGWTGPKEVDGKKVEDFWRSHQVPVANAREDDAHRRILEDWMRSYGPEKLFDADGRLMPELAALAPTGARRMGANPHANGGLLRRELTLPDWKAFAVEVRLPGGAKAEATRIMGCYLRDVMSLNAEAKNFRIVGPDETTSNRLDAVLEVTDRVWMERIESFDVGLSRDGRVMEVLSEHLCQGWLEGYLLTGRHGLFSCYEAFIHIVDSMVNQHAKWLKTSGELAWRKPISSLNYLLTSHVWRQDHNGFSHQDPGFADFVANKKADTVRLYFPPDANTLLWVTDHCLRTYNRINVITAGKQPAPQWLTAEAADAHCRAGAGIWNWACTCPQDQEPDVVMACAGDVPTLETLAAVDLLRSALPDLKIRVVNVVDLMTLQSNSEHPHGLADAAFDALFTKNRPVIFAYHGYPYLIHRLTYKRANHDNMHVHGFREEGTTTTPFDMVVLNQLDRFNLALAAIARVPGLADRAGGLVADLKRRLAEHKSYIREHGDDMPEIRNWNWSQEDAAGVGH
ncbi:MAG: phosphoketolase family protein [Mesorhizobium sp.]|uniref:phosphoketolase family protein n=1 Tax=unclassified Mesorhizobium TaxID=325217 RepID=UPI000FCC0392|nr:MULTISPECIES: phosphoketolase family protein [unclassified Mesorhizobium]RUV74808.1 phosphoketolase family protein [Mesorhizobium sp. M5C.F.Cr.IN.023.01.1.1]RWF88684.1 MAG: phosphoketolase family protein [Mesorhizobium sp.]RWF92924.1 MAG: phosphoketolase family protein [Mesorhizobium sp.]RWI41247.1 MAG: phosphoketolase family protein [Mesorhizobium sp.]RWI49761.1 MAG: phosphoketolase family protein [Mesorhizobium sp.]